MKNMRKKRARYWAKGECIGIPVRCVEKGDTVFLKVDDLLRLRKQVAALRKAMAKIDVKLGPASHLAGGHLFVPTFAPDDAVSGTEGKQAIEPHDLKARILAAASPNTACGPPVSASPDLDSRTKSDPQPELGVEVTPITGKLPVDLIRKGPTTLKIGSETISYSAGCPSPELRIAPPAAPSKTWIDRVGTEVHLLDSQHHRLRAEEPHQVAGIRPGTLVAAENCRVEKVLIAGLDAFRVQPSLDFDEGE